MAMVGPLSAQYLPPGGVDPGYKWREERAQDDWRNNTWREQGTKQDWRNNTWQEKRANEDRQYSGHDGFANGETKTFSTTTAATDATVTARCQRLAASRGIPQTKVPHSLWDSFIAECQAGKIR